MRKIYVSDGQNSYANWMDGKLTKNIEEADLLLLTGGSDISPRLYNEPTGSRTWANERRDAMEVEAYYKAKELGIKVFGTCRGLQLLTALNGGRLIQHMQHPGSHKITLFDGQEVAVNSLHHQMCYPFNLDKTKYKILGFSNSISPVYLDGEDKQIELPENFVEPEIIMFNENEMGVQYHPEMMPRNVDGFKATKELFEKFMNNELEM